MGIVIAGFGSLDKVPGAYGETVFGAGGSNASSIPLTLLLTGTKTSAGTSTVDSSIDDIFSENDAMSFYGAGSELHRMCRAALRVPGIRLKAAPVAEAGTPATATVTIAGSWTSAGTWIGRIAGERIQAPVGAADSVTTVAAAIKAAINGNSRLPVTADNTAGVLTITSKQSNIRANQLTIVTDKSQLPTGLTSVAAGGASIGSNGQVSGIYMSSGATADVVTNVLALLYPGRYHRIAMAQADATNAALVKTYINSKAGVLEGRMEHVIMANSDTLAASKSIAQTTLNDQRFEYCWLLASETPPAEIAAVMGAMRLQAEQQMPNSGYDGKVLPGVVAQLSNANWPSRSSLVSCLDNSLTPLQSQPDGTVTCVRAITTRSLSGSNPDYTTLDVSQAVVPDFVRDDLRVVWTTQFVVANQYVRNEPSADEPRPPSGVAFPSLWGSEVSARLRAHERASILTQVTANPPIVDYDSVAQRIMAIVPTIPTPINHQVGNSVRQMNPA